MVTHSWLETGHVLILYFLISVASISFPLQYAGDVDLGSQVDFSLSFFMLKLSQVATVGASSSWLQCLFDVIP